MKKLQHSRSTKASSPGPLPSVRVRGQAAAYKERNIRAANPQFTVCVYKVLLMQTLQWQNWKTIPVIKQITKFMQLQTRILKIPRNCDIFALPEKWSRLDWVLCFLTSFYKLKCQLFQVKSEFYSTANQKKTTLMPELPSGGHMPFTCLQLCC